MHRVQGLSLIIHVGGNITNHSPNTKRSYIPGADLGGALGAEAPPPPRLPPFAEIHYHQPLSSLYMLDSVCHCQTPL